MKTPCIYKTHGDDMCGHILWRFFKDRPGIGANQRSFGLSLSSLSQADHLATEPRFILWMFTVYTALRSYKLGSCGPSLFSLNCSTLDYSKSVASCQLTTLKYKLKVSKSSQSHFSTGTQEVFEKSVLVWQHNLDVFLLTTTFLPLMSKINFNGSEKNPTRTLRKREKIVFLVEKKFCFLWLATARNRDWGVIIESRLSQLRGRVFIPRTDCRAEFESQMGQLLMRRWV